MEIRNQLRAFIIDNFMIGRDSDELKDSASLLELGIIDSTGVLELVGFLEDTYGLQVEDTELVPNNLDTIESIERYIVRKTA